MESSPLGLELGKGELLTSDAGIVAVEDGLKAEPFQLTLGKTSDVANRYSFALLTLVNARQLRWQIEVRAYDDGVALRYRIPAQENLRELEILEDSTQFNVVGEPVALYCILDGFHTSHEALFERGPLAETPSGKLLEMPLVLCWEKRLSAAITEARVLDFAGAYLERAVESNSLRCRLSPHSTASGVSVIAQAPQVTPWRVVMLADEAGQHLESNLLACLNDEPKEDFTWVHPGKTTFPWWNGEFEQDFKSAPEDSEFLKRNFAYIDFCARNNIAYHGVAGDGRAWYRQSSDNYGFPSADADVLTPRPEIHLPEILAYAKQRGVGIRLWVHWQPLSKCLEEAFALYESWGVKGLMVDFLDRDDQQMIEWTELMLKCAARHHLHIQIHGSPKFSGEQRTFPNLLNREGVLNLEYNKWSKHCTPAHNVNVAYTRGLAGPVDYHLGGFRSISRSQFEPRDHRPNVMGTRCHNMALYVVYENPMPMVADAPDAYEGQLGFDFIKEVPTTWDETRFVEGEPGEYVVIARRKGDSWYLGGITNWTPREIDLPLKFLGPNKFEARWYTDGSMDESRPNEVSERRAVVDAESSFHLSLATGGGFVAVIRPR